MESKMLLAVVLLLTQLQASVQTCASGFLDPQYNTTDSNSPLVRLIGRQGTFGSSEQWIFPNMSFTCNGLLTKWTFRSVSRAQGVGKQCRLLLTTWRLDTQTTSATAYRRISTTRGNLARIEINDPFFTYTMATPAQVQSGDIVGIAIGPGCAPGNLNNIMSLDVSGSGSNFLSYFEPNKFKGLTFFLNPLTTSTETNLIPLIKAVIEQPEDTAEDVNSNLGNREQQGRATTGDANTGFGNNQQNGGSSTVAIAAGVPCGIIGLIILVAICICIGYVLRHVQPRVQYEQRYPEDSHMPDHTSPSGLQLQANIAYQQQLDNSESRTINSRNADLSNQVDVRLHSEARSQIEREDEVIQMTSHNVAYQLQGNQTHNRDAHSAMPPSRTLPTPPLHEMIPDEEEHPYEYITIF